MINCYITNDRLKEIFELMITNLIERPLTLDTGICKVIEVLSREKIITLNETKFVKQYLFLNKPSVFNQYKEFTQNEYWLGRVFWWNVICDAPETKQIRIDFITALINNIK